MKSNLLLIVSAIGSLNIAKAAIGQVKDVPVPFDPSAPRPLMANVIGNSYASPVYEGTLTPPFFYNHFENEMWEFGGTLYRI